MRRRFEVSREGESGLTCYYIIQHVPKHQRSHLVYRFSVLQLTIFFVLYEKGVIFRLAGRRVSASCARNTRAQRYDDIGTTLVADFSHVFTLHIGERNDRFDLFLSFYAFFSLIECTAATLPASYENRKALLLQLMYVSVFFFFLSFFR